MRTGNLVLLALQAASAVMAVPAPQETAPETVVPTDPLAALDQLAELGNATFAQVEEELIASEKKRTLPGSCTLLNLKIRREWYVISLPPAP